MRRVLQSLGGPLAAAVMACGPIAAGAQTLFVCEGPGGQRVFAGTGAAEGCGAVSVGGLGLSGPVPDSGEIARRIDALAARVDRLERRMLTPQVRPAPLVPQARPQADPFDTRGRLRDLGQDLDRTLDELLR